MVVLTKKTSILEQEVKTFGEQIGLLLSKQISAQVVSQRRNHAQENQNLQTDAEIDAVLKYYQSFLQLLHDDPRYLVKLSQSVSLRDASSLVEFILNTLFHNPHDRREELKLLKIIQLVLEAEWMQTSDPSSFMRNNSCAPKFLTAYTKRGPCVDVLKEALTDPMNKVLRNPPGDLELDRAKVSHLL